MAFHDVQLPSDVERGAQGGPRFNTTILELSSGFEKRNINWSRSRADWDLSYGIDDKTDHEAVLTFFYARQGRGHSFRFKDWTDFEIGVDSTDTPQTIALGDNVQKNFQVIRAYASGSQTFNRPITKLVVGTVRVFLAGVEQFAGFTVDVLTGVITFTAAPGSSVVIGVICEFDAHARFDDDHLPLRAQLSDVYSLPAIMIKEVRDDLVVLT